MEADVNVLVVGSSTARRGAIGRHFPFPLIRRCLKPVLRRWLLRFLRANARQARLGTDPPRGVVKAEWEKRVCEWGGWEGGVSVLPVSLLIWRTSASKADSPGAPVAYVYLHQHGGHKPPSPGFQKGSGTTASLWQRSSEQ